MVIRKYEDKDAEPIAKVLCMNFREVNIKDYSKERIEQLIKENNADKIRTTASYAHMYVVCDNKKVIGCGAISSFWGSETESILLTIFILPEYHGQGIGRKIIQTLEQDELFLRAKRIEIPASITACGFYEKMGYKYKNNIKQLDDEGNYRMEKFC